MPQTYDYVLGTDLTGEQREALSLLRDMSAGLRDNNPEELEDFLGGYISINESVSELSTNRITAYMLQTFEAASEEDETLETLDLTFKEKFPVASSQTLVEYLDLSPPMEFSGYNADGEDGCDMNCATYWQWVEEFGYYDGACETDCAGMAVVGDGNCDCVAACDGYNLYSDCYIECGCDSGYTPPDGEGWTLPDLGSTLGNILAGIGSAIQSVGEEIGWGNIFNSFFNTNDDGDSQDAPTNNGGGDDDDDDEGTNWGKIALYSVLGIGVVVGGYFLIKKLRK